MPRKSTAKATGVWEKEAGSNIWWIRYRADGVLKREKVGRKSDAIALYQKRKSELRVGIKLPDNMRKSSLRFQTLCDDILVYSKKHHRDYRSVVHRLNRIKPAFGELQADAIKPAEIEFSGFSLPGYAIDLTRCKGFLARTRTPFGISGELCDKPCRVRLLYFYVDFALFISAVAKINNRIWIRFW